MNEKATENEIYRLYNMFNVMQINFMVEIWVHYWILLDLTNYAITARNQAKALVRLLGCMSSENLVTAPKPKHSRKEARRHRDYHAVDNDIVLTIIFIKRRLLKIWAYSL
uniref:Uncharacterized protein n=1 Tax=Glossina palpalis gambiensis TaxID=67801 RepID=A0A1B0C6E4_9MUSC